MITGTSDNMDAAAADDDDVIKHRCDVIV